MPSDAVGKQLHDKATRGLPLSAHEQAQLDAWYAGQDKEDNTLLGPFRSSVQLATLQTQVETALAQLLTVTQRIQELTAQNDAVRREITVLQRQLAHTSTR